MMEITIKGQYALHEEVRQAKFCTGCGACVIFAHIMLPMGIRL